MAKTFTIDLSNADRAAAGYDAMAARTEDLTQPLGLLCVDIRKRTNRDVRSGKYGLWARSGLMGNSTTHLFPTPTSAAIGSNAAQARLLQQGGTVEPVEAKVLAIPIADNLGAREQPKYTSPLDVPEGRWITTSGKPIFIKPKANLRKRREVRGRNRTGFQTAMMTAALPFRYFNEVLFVGLPRVTVKAYHWVRYEAEDAAKWAVLAKRWIIQGK